VKPGVDPRSDFDEYRTPLPQVNYAPQPAMELLTPRMSRAGTQPRETPKDKRAGSMRLLYGR